jgi:hypothetical protein
VTCSAHQLYSALEGACQKSCGVNVIKKLFFVHAVRHSSPQIGYL